MTKDDTKEIPKVHGTDPYRYVIITLYISVAILNGMANNPLTPISETTVVTYDVTNDKITLTTTLCQIAQVLMALPSIKIASTCGVRMSVTIGALLITLGFLCRTLINQSLYYVAAGQFIAGSGGPLIGVLQARVVTDWFNKDQRGVWLALGGLGPVLGVMVGFVMPLFFITDSKTTPIEVQKVNLRNYLFSEFIMIAILFGLIVLLWRSSPGTSDNDGSSSSSKVSARQTFYITDPKEGDIDSLFTQIKICFQRGAVRSMFIINGIQFGLVTAVGSLITPFLSAFSYPEYYGPLLAVAVVLSGLTATIVYSAFLLSHRYQYINSYILTGAATILFCALSIAIYFKSGFLTIMVIACLFGMPGISITVMVIEEIIRRVHTNILMTATNINAISGQIVAAILTYVSGFYLEYGNEYSGGWVMVCFSGCFLFVFFFCFAAEMNLVEDNKRQKEIKNRLMTESGESEEGEKDLNSSGGGTII